MLLEDVFVCLYQLLRKYIVLNEAMRVCRVNKYLAKHNRTTVIQSREFCRVFGKAPAGSPAQLQLYYVYRDLYRYMLVGLKHNDTELLKCTDALWSVIRLQLQPPPIPSYASLPQTVLQYRTWLGMLRCDKRDCQQNTNSKLLLEKLQDCDDLDRPWLVSTHTYAHADVAFTQLWKIEAQKELPVHDTEKPGDQICNGHNQDDPLCTPCYECTVQKYYLQSAFQFSKWKPLLFHHLRL